MADGVVGTALVYLTKLEGIFRLKYEISHQSLAGVSVWLVYGARHQDVVAK